MRRTVPLASVLLLVVIGVGSYVALMPSDPSPRTSSDQASSGGRDGFAAQRAEMVDEQIAARGVEDRRILAAIAAVPRHEFVPRAQVEHAYSDGPLPIGFGQTISQPYIVALMTELAEVGQGDNVLEVGTGSGYQAAVLAELSDRVHSVEIVPELARSAADRLRRVGYPSIRVREGDGYFGWERYAPFDAILVTAAPDHVPPPLIRQLKEGGRMVIPVGPPGSYQTLWRIRKTGGEVVSENVTDVAFVPLTREPR
jgi:protein-L-isoaspartate(D-aspartate) O-methyltransferase